MAKNTKTPVMVLQELCVKKGYPTPAYEIIHSITGTHHNRFDYQVCVAGVSATGTGSSKQISKHNAAHNLLMKLKELNIYNPSENPVQEFQTIIPNKKSDSNAKEDFKSFLNFIGPLKDLCMEQKIPDPEFVLISDIGPPHSREFTYECSVAGIKTIARGNTKKTAKQLAAKEMMERINDVLPDIVADYKKEENFKAISDTDNKALEKYNQMFGNVVADKSVPIRDYSHTLKKLMIERDLSINDFVEDLKDASEDSLKKILAKLDLNYNVYHMQDKPTIIFLTLTTDTPFTTMGVAPNEELSLMEAIKNAFEIMNLFLRL